MSLPSGYVEGIEATNGKVRIVRNYPHRANRGVCHLSSDTVMPVRLPVLVKKQDTSMHTIFPDVTGLVSVTDAAAELLVPILCWTTENAMIQSP